MSPQQIAMIEALQKRNITKVIVKPNSEIEHKCAKVALVNVDEKSYSATIDQLKKYYELQNS